MYANQFGPSSPGLSNNPFVEDPTTAHARFPDINASTYQPGYQPNGQPQYNPNVSYQTQPQISQTQFSYPSQYQAYGQMGAQPTSFSTFQQSSGFQQQYPGIPNGYPYSSHTAYPTQSSNTTPSYLAEFDPYARAQSQPQHQAQIAQAQAGAATIGPNGVTHPRDLIRVHKSGLEAWDTYSWRQLLSACDALKEAWSVRKQQAEGVVRQYGGPDPTFGHNSQVEGWKQVLRDANSNFDTVAACTFQLHEVFNSYRQSADPASKRRVRESCNAAVKGLPDWPSN